MTNEPEREQGGAAPPLVALLVAAALICAGSIGVAGYMLWRASRNAAERERDKEIQPKQVEPKTTRQ